VREGGGFTPDLGSRSENLEREVRGSWSRGRKGMGKKSINVDYLRTRMNTGSRLSPFSSEGNQQPRSFRALKFSN